MEKSREEREGVFIEWTTFIEDRVDEWKETIPKDIASKLDWSPKSLKIIEEYVLEHYTIDDQQNPSKRIALDAMVSYITDVFRKNIPETVWEIELDDKSNVYYNLPYLVFKLGAPLCPHHLLQDILLKDSELTLIELFNISFEDWLEYKAYMDKQKNK